MATKDIECLSVSPPPYEAKAYTHRRQPRFRRRLLKACSIPVFLALTLTLGISYLCILVERGVVLGRAPAKGLISPVATNKFDAALKACAARHHRPAEPTPETREANSRWNAVRGQGEIIVLRNATLFDGESFVSGPVDIRFSKGLINSVTQASNTGSVIKGAKEFNLQGRYVTPGLVDMHSHHTTGSWPGTSAIEDNNEINPMFGTLTPFLRIIDSMKAYDKSTEIIASGGITTSLILPGSANTMGGEGAVIKNMLKSGESGEYVVEEMLLERGIPAEDRHRYMKFACGENPKHSYDHVRFGLAYILRRHLSRAKQLMEKQDAWCEAAMASSRLLQSAAAEQARFMEHMGDYPEELELESTIGLMRGRIAMHNHCYESDDMETMLRVTREFGVRVRAFHHAIEAWQVPEMLKEYGENITVATFAELSLFKQEAYYPNLYAGAILNKHGVPVAYKSDHFFESTNAKYVLSQAAIGHSFHLPAEKALQSVTSVPAKAIDMAHRVGYVRNGYDADIVVWDSHPLSIGATPQQVFIDGVATLKSEDVEKATGSSMEAHTAPLGPVDEPRMRVRKPARESNEFCASAKQNARSFVVQGIQKSFLYNYPQLPRGVSPSGKAENLTLVIHKGQVACLDTQNACKAAVAAIVTANNKESPLHFQLQNGHLLPGLTAMTNLIGLKELPREASTGNGAALVKEVRDPVSIDYAKYGVYLEGKGFARARMGGVTRIITPPELGSDGMLQGVSAGLRTSGTRTLLDGGIFQDDVGLHVVIGNANKAKGSVSQAIQTLRGILRDNKGKANESAYGLVADGRMPLLVSVVNLAATQQVIAIKRDFPNVNIVVNGGHAAPLVANELADAGIPVILSATRPGFANWEGKDYLVGPPLTRSPASMLSEAGVLFSVAVKGDLPEGDSRIQSLALEAAWAAKYAGLSDHQAVQLVSKNTEHILGLAPSRDLVLWENNPLQFGASVALSFEEDQEGKLVVATCWPDDDADDSI
ncbi:carbohydrate esterase family 9 [Apiospora arundinis]|uniref:Amidohydrolase-related domain-containing protein n=1 Tax=Apiospora arundinis TaxID=335852 RepID=A0ABR2I0K7_9PEZI